MKLPNIKWTYQDFEDYVLSHEAYMYDRTLYIDKDGKDVKIVSDTYEEYFAKVQIKLAEAFDTIKVEGIERLCDFTDGTIHAFRYWEGSPSFGEHTDPVDVIIHQCEGAKVMEVAGNIKDIIEDEFLMIPANTPHRALNDKEGLMFSYGLSDTEQPTSLRKDNGDLQS
jgi:mannose-6-phosphate isomerase-like protein (cupin superfamily)